MKKNIVINGKPYTVRTRTEYAPKEKYIKSKKVYNRKKTKKGKGIEKWKLKFKKLKQF